MLGLTTIAIAAGVLCLAPSARAQATNTITITGTFTSDSGEQTWSLAMYGTTYLHYGYISSSHYGSISTDVRATSFELRFSGPDADEFNRFASEQLAEGDVGLTLRNVYQEGGNSSTMALEIWSPDASFFAGHESFANPGLFPSDADGYPVVTPEPFPFWNEEIYISAYGFFYGDWPGPNAEISGSLGSEPPAPPATLSIGDASVVEGNRGRSQLPFTVSRSGSGEGMVSVDYRTVAGTALAKSDYTAASGTLTFPPGVWSQTITITVKTDRRREPDETFTVELFNAVGGTVGDAVATGTILNDD
jgi:Calx-beta domain